MPEDLHQLRGGRGVGSTPGWGQGAGFCGGSCVSRWEEGAAGRTPVGGGCQAAAWERGGVEAPYSGPQSWYKWLVRSGLGGLSKLTCDVYLPWTPCARHLHSVERPISLVPEE